MDNIQDLENQLLTQIRNLLSQINNYVLQLQSLNEYEKNISGNPYILYNYQMQEINNLINLMKLLISILESIKDYITLYYKEISGNTYITPNIKVEIIGQINNGIKEIKSMIDKLFVEIEILTNNLQRF
ncbi:hypothetical protein [Candidatus Nanobsidianus stetteri]|jgi:hypothetical protein|uniref:Uncharacterized protein n=1 Tax=Nanobsidianus stetteri TaxID=1294122 RepID=A0A2T9WLU7_NANST|nr:hypothetical protein [Candidatus Nanobsidianus stetteri]MCC5447036.1 hypothetical protein [Candidatus Nanobsidianus stetteri]